MYKYIKFINEQNSNSDIRNYCIFFDNIEESIHICKILLKLGFHVYNSINILLGDHAKYWKCYKLGKLNDFTRSPIDYIEDNEHHMKYEEFMKKFNNGKIKKISNSEIDPYGEDDWVFIEEQNENRKINKKEFILNSAIHFNTDREMIDIAMKLYKMGFAVKNYKHIVVGSSPKKDYEYFVYFEKTKKFSRIEDFPKNVEKHYTYRQFVRIFNSKYVEEIQVPKLDPYGEEDWGILLVQEEPELKKPGLKKTRF